MKQPKETVVTASVPEDRKDAAFGSLAEQSEHVFAIEGPVARHLSEALYRWATAYRRSIGKRRGQSLPHPQAWVDDAVVAERPEEIGLWLLRAGEKIPDEVVEHAAQALAPQLGGKITLARRAIRGAIASSAGHLKNLMPEAA